MVNLRIKYGILGYPQAENNFIIYNFLSEFFEIFMSWPNKFGKFYKVWFGPDLKLVIQDPKDIEVSDSIYFCFRLRENEL